MTKILGLDLGTNSIGWAIVEREKTEFQLLDKGVRIFSEGVKSEKGIESSRAAERRAFRSARKLKFRRKLRKYETLHVLVRNNMCPLSIEEVDNWKKSGFKNYPLNPEFIKWLRTSDDDQINPYQFRAKASLQQVDKLELGRAFYHLAQRRGFLSNRLDQTAEGVLEEHCPQLLTLIEDATNVIEMKSEIQDHFEIAGIFDSNVKDGYKKDTDEGEKKLIKLHKSLITILNKNEDFEKCVKDLNDQLNKKENLGVVKQKINELTTQMKEGNFTTLGQLFNSQYNKAKIRNQYTAREEHYLDEFEIICKTQGLTGISETEQVKERRYSGLIKDLYRAIFFQRPLKSQKGLVGKCPFEKTKSRCAVSHPDFEEFRMWTYLNTIKLGTKVDKTMRFLSLEEKLALVPKFLRKKEHFDFADLAKELVGKNSSFGFYLGSKKDEVDFLFNYRPNDTVTGCPVSAAFSAVFGKNWKEIEFTYSTLNKDQKSVERKVDYSDLWHLLSVSTSDVYLMEYAKEKLNLDDKNSKAFSKIRLKKDYGNLSLSAINKILPYLKEGLLYSHAVFMANIEKIVEPTIWNKPEQRLSIRENISEIIENHSYENARLEIINGLIKNCKNEQTYYSKEAEPIYKTDLKNAMVRFFKLYHHEDANIQASLVDELFPMFMKQLKLNEFKKIKRLDEKVLEFLSGQNQDGEIYCKNQQSLKKLYHPSDIEVFKKVIYKDKSGNEQIILGSPLTQSIKNPMAMRALHQLRKVLNELIKQDQIDEKTIIHIEMARELNDANKRKGIQQFQNELKKRNEEALKDIKKLYYEECKKEIEPTGDDLLRYQLWIEQNRQEIYEPSINDGMSRKIAISQIIGENPDYDIEHTIPRSISQDNSQMNKTLCSKSFNRDIKKKSMPSELKNHEIILQHVKHWRNESEKMTIEIEKISRQIKAAATKEAKDKKITQRHYLTLKRDYLKGKYERFTWVEPKVGFKNSQIPDTGIITRYAQAYLKSYFKQVESVKGGMVAEFRKIWGIQESYQKDGKKYYTEKDRSKHTHHTIDAITIACMTKDKYDALAHAWTLEEKSDLQGVRTLLSNSKPWKTFKEDLKKIEDEILVSHYTPDNLKKQAKKIIRIRGKKQYVAEMVNDVDGKLVPKNDANNRIAYKVDEKGEKIPRLQQGDTIRGSLHQDSIYGAIKNPNDQNETQYVIRKDLESLKGTDIENIVDKTVREKVLEAIQNKVIVLSSNPQQKNKINEPVWMNFEKQIPIKKVRIIANSVKNPLEVKKHAALSLSKQRHKQMVYGQNDENYAMAIYELEGKKDFTLINNFEVANLTKEGKSIYSPFKTKLNKGVPIQMPIAKRNGKDLVLKRGQQVIFYDSEIEQPESISDLADLSGRIYIIEGLSIQRIVRPSGKIDEYGVVMFRYFREARKSDDLKKDNYKPDGSFKIGDSKPTRKMNHNQFTGFVEGIDFLVSTTGKIKPI
jgi:CRISPR-associated endonuclease Csn1